MFTRRYSGRVKLVCKFRDREENYACEIYKDGQSVGHVYVGLPGCWQTLPEYQNGVNSDEAFDETARTALSFAMDRDEDDEDFPLIDSADVEWSPTGDNRPVVYRTLQSGKADQQGNLDFGRRRA